MASRPILAGLLLLSAAPVFAQAATAPAFEQRVVGILNAGGSTDTVQGRLNRIGADPILTADQRIAIEAISTLVRGKARPKGLSLAEAEAFAARNPGSPASAMLLAEAALAAGQPQRSADTLIAAGARAGPLVQLVSPVMVGKLSDELDLLDDRKRTAELAKALLYAGWGRGSASLRSYLALAAIRDEMAAGRVTRARALLPAVKSPASLHLILIDNRLTPLRGEIEQAAGPRLEQAWREFLTRSRDEWLARGDLLSATAYAEALQQANQHEALAAAFVARFMRGYNCPTDTVARSVADALAESLAKSGRWTKAEDVMRRSGGVSPPVYGAMLLERGEFGRAQALFDRSLQAANAPKDKAEEKAMAWLRAARECAAFRNGRPAAASSYDPALLDVAARLSVLLCMERPAEARAALLAAFEDEDERADALRWVQPFTDPAVQSKFRKEMSEKVRVLQTDPEVLAVVAKYGVVLDWPLTAAAPAPSALPPPGETLPWQCGDQAGWDAAMPNPESIRMPDSEP